jgi:hypothetical protein
MEHGRVQSLNLDPVGESFVKVIHQLPLEKNLATS